MSAPVRRPLETSVLVFAMPVEPALRVLPLDDWMVIGRLGYGAQQEPATIQLFDERSSAGRHARLIATSDGVMLHDLGSTNTTLLNERRMTKPQLLQVGDQFQTGDSLFRFEHRLAGGAWPDEARPLLERVLERPEHDGARQVLADWLLARGDARGELIACQLQDTPRARARAEVLLEAHEVEWAAPLPVPVESWTFERGFLSSVRVRDVEAAQVLRRHHPLARIEPIPWTRVAWGRAGPEVSTRVQPPG